MERESIEDFIKKIEAMDSNNISEIIKKTLDELITDFDEHCLNTMGKIHQLVLKNYLSDQKSGRFVFQMIAFNFECFLRLFTQINNNEIIKNIVITTFNSFQDNVIKEQSKE